MAREGDEMTRNQIAYRCPECGTATVGLLGRLADVSDMLRLKCECGESLLEIKKTGTGIRLSVPCVFCKSSHTYTLSHDIAVRENITKLPCPYANMDIAFIGSAEDVSSELDRTGEELSRVIASFEGETLSDIQPSEVGSEDGVTDPAVYDTINFLLRDLESEGLVKCPCGEGKYDLRFTDNGIEVYCERCGASHGFSAKTQAMAEEYLSLDLLELK